MRLIMQQAREILEIRPSNEGNTGTNVGYMFRVMVNKLREEYDIVRWIFFFSFIFFSFNNFDFDGRITMLQFIIRQST